jgi:hypothetical protein
MWVGSRHPWILSTLLLGCNVLCTGCSALISYSGEDVGKLANKEQVRKAFGTPSKSGSSDGLQFDEYHTRRKISEPTVAGVQLILGAESLGLFELWNFPTTICSCTWTTLVGQNLRFEYAINGEVVGILINETPMELRAQLP